MSNHQFWCVVGRYFAQPFLRTRFENKRIAVDAQEINRVTLALAAIEERDEARAGLANARKAIFALNRDRLALEIERGAALARVRELEVLLREVGSADRETVELHMVLAALARKARAALSGGKP